MFWGIKKKLFRFKIYKKISIGVGWYKWEGCCLEEGKDIDYFRIW